VAFSPSNNTLYVSGRNQYLYAVDVTTGSMIWNFTRGTDFKNSPAVGPDGTIYCGSDILYALTPDGSLVWSYNIHGTTSSTNGNDLLFLSSPAIGSNGVIYIGSSNGYIYGLNGGDVRSSTSTTSSSGLSTTIIIAITVPIGTILFFAIVGMFYYIFRRKDHADVDKIFSFSATNPYIVELGSARSNKPGSNTNTKESGGTIAKVMNLKNVTQLKWSDLYLNTEYANLAIIGFGSFGTVVKANLVSSKDAKDSEVAVKLLTRSSASLISGMDFEKICQRAYREVQLMTYAQAQVMRKDCMVNVYGIASGSLPASLTSLFHLETGELGVGIVMKYQAGGSL
jgi:hypothetical protein